MDTNTSFVKCLFENCNAKLPSIRQLLFHMRLVHPFDKNCQLRCCIERCEKVYSTCDSYRKHVEREHRSELDLLDSHQFSLRENVHVVGNTDESADRLEVDTAPQDTNDLSYVMQMLARNVTMFVLQTRECHSLPKSTCSSIVNDVSVLFSTFTAHFCDFILSRLESNGIDVSRDATLYNALVDRSLMDSLWSDVASDAKISRYCKEYLGLVEPERVILGIDSISGKEECYQYVPICKTLQHYLNHSDVWESLHRVPVKVPDVLYDYTDGSSFKEHNYFSVHNGALRVHLYIDDLELCNPLGGAKKKHCITAVYFQLGNVEQKHMSALRTIHVACIAKSVHVKKYGLHKVLERFMQDICILQSEGITVTIDGKVQAFFGSLATVSGDNLASHDIGGFRGCFNSGRVCRFCMVCYDQIKEFTSETNEGYPKLRTQKEHDLHTQAVLADATLASVYGVNKQAALQSLECFHATSSLPPDCMHDMLEGVIPIVLKVCLRGLIVDKIITTRIFNERMQTYKFGRNDSTNIPPLLAPSFPKCSISGSASQKWCLFRNLAFVVGDLVPSGNKYWELYILCRKMTEIIFSHAVTLSQIAYLDVLIADHHTLLLHLAFHDFTPKCHFVTHYPRLMTVYGPLRHLWCMRFESYHQYLKGIAQNTGNFKNICHTLANRNQMKKCFEQSGDRCLMNDEVVTVLQNNICIRSLPQSLQAVVTRYYNCSLAGQVVSVQSAAVDGVHYAVRDCFILDVLDCDTPVFFKIGFILLNDGIWGLAGNLVFCSEYLPHYHAYAVNCDPDWIIVSPGSEKTHTALDMQKICIEGVEHKAIALRHTIPNQW